MPFFVLLFWRESTPLSYQSTYPILISTPKIRVFFPIPPLSAPLPTGKKKKMATGVENPRSATGTAAINGGFEENAMAILDSTGVKDSRDVLDDSNQHHSPPLYLSLGFHFIFPPSNFFHSCCRAHVLGGGSNSIDTLPLADYPFVVTLRPFV